MLSFPRMKKEGVILQLRRLLMTFLPFYADSALFDIFPSNGSFTWTNRRSKCQIFSRLDRFLISLNLHLSNFSFSSEILTSSDSNHFPILLNFDKLDHVPSVRPSFKFEKMWFTHPHFLSLLKQWWISALFCKGTKMYQFYSKLKFVKSQIMAWNKLVFKNIFYEKEAITNDWKVVNEEIIRHGTNSSTNDAQKKLQAYWEILCSRIEIYWLTKVS